MQVILLERVEKLGQMGDVVTVKDGYARNYLLPQHKALRATEANRQRFEQERAQLEARNLERRQEAEKVGEKLDGQSFVILRQAGESGQLYGSVTTRDIAALVTEGGFNLARGQVHMDTPIKTLGIHATRIALHPEVIITVHINVARTLDEAERQARGENVLLEEDTGEEEEGLSAEEVFEREDLAQAAEQELAEVAEATEEETADTEPKAADPAQESDT